MNHPVRVQVINVWLVCKSCRGSFPDVTAFLAHKTEKHFDEFKTVKSIIFEERIDKDDIEIDSNFLAGCHNLELPAEENKNENVDVVFDVESSHINPRQIEPDESSPEPDQRQVYTCKFTNPNQENAVDFTIEDECVIINISRLNPNLSEFESVDQVKSEAVYEDFEYGDEIEILEFDQHNHQPGKKFSEINVSAATLEPEDVYQDVDVDVETEDISHGEVMTSNEAFQIEAGEVSCTNANSATHDSSTSQLDINSDPTNADSQIPASTGDDVFDSDSTNATNQLEANSLTIHTISSASPLNIDLTSPNLNNSSDPDLSLTELVDATNHVVNTDVSLISENKISFYAEKLDEAAFNSGLHNDPESNLNCVKNPYVLLKPLTFEELELASVTWVAEADRQQQNHIPKTDSISDSDYSDQAQTDIESDTDPSDPDFDPCDVDSHINFDTKSLKSKIKQSAASRKNRRIKSQSLSVRKPFACSICSLAFSDQLQLIDHNLKIHSINPFKCTHPNCNRIFSCKSILENHRKGHDNPSNGNSRCYVFPPHLNEDGTDQDGAEELPLREWLKNQQNTDNIIILEPDPLTTEYFSPISLTNLISCKLCTKSLTSETQVKIHAKNCWTNNTKRHRYCVPCKKSLSGPEKLQLHKVRFHSTEEEKDILYPFKCKQCNKKFLRLCYLKYHQETHKSSENRIHYVACHVCGKPDVHKSYLENHLATHSNDKPFHCPEPDCNVFCKSKMSMRFHRRRVHAKSRPFKCSQCSYSAKTMSDLKNHSFIHTKEKKLRKPLRYFRCTQDKCDKKYASREPLRIHIKKCHNIGPDLKTFSCQICKKSFASATTLKNHQLVHTETREFKCTFAGCNADFRIKYKLVEHVREHSGIKPYVCETCGKSYSKCMSFHKHKKSHENLLNQHLCSYCPRKFPGSWELKQHLLVHEKGAQFVCQFCGKKCSKKENLKIHEQSHNKPRKTKQQGSKTRGKKKKCTDHLSSSSLDSEDSE